MLRYVPHVNLFHEFVYKVHASLPTLQSEDKSDVGCGPAARVAPGDESLAPFPCQHALYRLLKFVPPSSMDFSLSCSPRRYHNSRGLSRRPPYSYLPPRTRNSIIINSNSRSKTRLACLPRAEQPDYAIIISSRISISAHRIESPNYFPFPTPASPA